MTVRSCRPGTSSSTGPCRSGSRSAPATPSAIRSLRWRQRPGPSSSVTRWSRWTPAARSCAQAAARQLSYDALVLGLGAALQPLSEHATNVDDARMDELLHGLVQDIEGGYVHRLAIVVPGPMPWPFPAYELALMASERAWDMQTELDVTVLTPERAPLEIFGEEASRATAQLLADRADRGRHLGVLRDPPVTAHRGPSRRTLRRRGPHRGLPPARRTQCGRAAQRRRRLHPRGRVRPRARRPSGSGPRAMAPITRSSRAGWPPSWPTRQPNRSPRSPARGARCARSRPSSRASS